MDFDVFEAGAMDRWRSAVRSLSVDNHSKLLDPAIQSAARKSIKIHQRNASMAADAEVQAGKSADGAHRTMANRLLAFTRGRREATVLA
ncbi:hypothetical protein WDZ92_38840, partial [Nostoc sp. NIES-2111]